MANWLSLSNLRGMYTSPLFPIPVQTDGALSKITWDCEVPQGTKVIVQTRSLDNFHWSEWIECVNSGEIPQVNALTPLYGKQLQFRVLIQSTDYAFIPKFKSLNLWFEPVLVFENKGDLNCSPEIWITKHGNGDFKIINTSNRNETFAFTSLIDQEVVYVNNEQAQIETSVPVTYRYANFNDNYLDFPVGLNVLRVVGNATIKFRYQFKRLQ